VIVRPANWLRQIEAAVAAACCVLIHTATNAAYSQTAPTTKLGVVRDSSDTPAEVLSPDEWKRVDLAVNRGLDWLASQQQDNGSFPTLDLGQPGVTSLCVLAFMAHGHGPRDGKYGDRLERAVDFILHCQKPNGIIALEAPDGPALSRDVGQEMGNCAVYNHGISSLTISELYGTTKSIHAVQIEATIKRALAVTLTMQRWPKDRPVDDGGWRYLHDDDATDSDLSATGWQLKFLRSARNGGFNVPEKSIDDAVAYIRRCYDNKYGAFVYSADTPDTRSRGTAGAGILALAHAGYHNSPEALQTGDWILNQGFKHYNVHANFNRRYVHDRYHYGLFMCCQGMYQLGGRYWKAFFPPVVETVLANQQADGSWPAENHHYDFRYGNAYTTALVLLTLGAPNQLLPIYQR
jgi:hypothetical protein